MSTTVILLLLSLWLPFIKSTPQCEGIQTPTRLESGEYDFIVVGGGKHLLHIVINTTIKGMLLLINQLNFIGTAGIVVASRLASAGVSNLVA
jgi:hypothetical protein